MGWCTTTIVIVDVLDDGHITTTSHHSKVSFKGGSVKNSLGYVEEDGLEGHCFLPDQNRIKIGRELGQLSLT